MISALLLVCFFHLGALITAHREHKVHNIVLYPEKHSWCKTTPIKQVVGHPGCEQMEVDNNVCVGACFSYSIPRTEPTAPGEVAPYCDSCQPSRVTWKHVILTCTGGEQETMTKRVEVIEDCSCLTCRQEESSDSGPESTSVDVPQLLNMMSHPKGNVSHSVAHIKHGDNKIGLLLKMIAGRQDEAEGDNQEGAENRLEAIISEMKENGVNEELQGLAEKAEEKGQVKVDIGKFKELLSKIETKHNSENHHIETEPSVHRHQHGLHHVSTHHTKIEEEEILPNPTLDISSHHLRPAIEGSEITYLPQTSPTHTHHHSHKLEE
ncbi:uncharacterized protein LOC106670372 [Cimex lectularius]|uniref:CTCK domain-containing protein n=1 Tax=Cimex lectularius TaxID=79782 RepID=A0A8I6TGK5_CIMLE|nr:uncharacterized protein LOC106670372 [Cimex lectularius]XP_014256123.1 uncharacterized protein LOC106670372 [Cimex lectularius]